MPLITAASAPQFTIPGVTFTGLASPTRGASDTAVWTLSLAPGSVGATHQLTREEIFVCLSGTASIRLGDAVLTLSPGDTLIVPPHTDFGLDNPGDTPFTAVAVFPVGGQAILPGQTPFTPPWAA
ncbi:MAG: cupin [Devosia sp.]|uniref:cupin domain-containing protein n=1 Tax=Devosia sp. TaxID=1871048 RepID=UPI00262DE38B|nr:cupin domain-containing protein [Devosia sp.]MDB5589323.1 cupin [Devosia sp.]